ncbi:MAG: putative zinc-binding metallopeptidase [Cytophagales bacterium]|nr:putative zinc-binding metallopeptidase [Cytophagales bacterium]
MLQNHKLSAVLVMLMLMLLGCKSDESVSFDPLPKQNDSNDPLDKYLYAEFQQTFNCMVRYRFVNRYVDDSKRVTPPDRSLVQPYMDFLKDHWVHPYLESGSGSETLIRKLFPAEIVLIGSPMYNLDGTVTLGTADAGVRITLTEVNDFDLENLNWKISQLHVMQHEFSHIIHQKYDLPDNYQKISEGDYTGSGWTIKDYSEMLRLGFVTPYASSDPNEDFAELVSNLLTLPESFFYERFLDINRNELGVLWAETDDGNADPEVVRGKLRIQEKYEAVQKYFKEVLDIDFEMLRTNTLARLFPPSVVSQEKELAASYQN